MTHGGHTRPHVVHGDGGQKNIQLIFTFTLCADINPEDYDTESRLLWCKLVLQWLHS